MLVAPISAQLGSSAGVRFSSLSTHISDNKLAVGKGHLPDTQIIWNLRCPARDDKPTAVPADRMALPGQQHVGFQLRHFCRRFLGLYNGGPEIVPQKS